MGIYTGTAGRDSITPAFVSLGVTSDPLGSRPSAAADTINGLAGKDVLRGGGGDDAISAAGAGTLMRGDAGNDKITYETTDDQVGVKAYGDAGNDDIRFNSSQPSGGSPAGKLSFFGGTGNDQIDAFGLILSDYGDLTIKSYGEAGNDRLEALALGTLSAFDALDPGKNPDYLYGGRGDDSYLVREGQDVVSEKAGQGYDTVEIDHSRAGLDSYTLGPNLEKLIVQEPTFYGLGGCELTGNDLDNVITATTTADKLVGAGGNDTLYGGPIGENASEDTGADDFFGGNGNDTIYGFGGDDTMSGQAGNDTMYGDAGNDRMVGGTGLDRLSGGGNEDIYDYNMLTDSKPGGSRDVVLDFEGVGTAGGDHIDLSTIDAVGGGTNDTFDFIGTNAFTGPGQVRVRPSGLDTLIQANTSGAAGTELEIIVSDGGFQPQQWAESDFIL